MEHSDVDQATAQPNSDGLSWSDLLSAYRSNRSQASAAAILERLGPWLTNARRALGDLQPYADAEDIAQQLVVEVLRKAARWEPRCEEQWIPRQLVEPAERQVRRRLRRESKRQPVELLESVPAPMADDRLIFDTPIGKASAADLVLIYRYHVAGERLEDMARRAGITPRAMRRRIYLAKERARA